MAYPATVLVLATATSYPPPPDLFGGSLAGTTMPDPRRSGVGITSGRLAGRPSRNALSGRSGRRPPAGRCLWWRADHRFGATPDGHLDDQLADHIRRFRPSIGDYRWRQKDGVGRAVGHIPGLPARLRPFRVTGLPPRPCRRCRG